MADEAPNIRIERKGAESRLYLTGDWIAHETGLRNEEEIRKLLSDAQTRKLRLDVTGVGRWDSALVMFVRSLKNLNDNLPESDKASLILSDLPNPVLRLLSLAETERETERPLLERSSYSLSFRVGRSFLDYCQEAINVASLVGETALRGVVFLRGRAQVRAVDMVQLIKEAGADALGIVAIVNVLVGAILAFVGAVQLKRFGAGIYIVDLVGISMIREMAAVVTAIVMAGRTGGAYAAHLATMQGNEEIDALKVLGIPVYDFLVLPRVTALVVMMPLLYIYACAVGLLGGFVVSVMTLDLTSAGFINQLHGAIAGRQFFIGLTKSIAFGALVALAGCHIGLKAGRSAADVGRAATSAVVAGIVGIIALDAVFAVCANALGI